MKKRIFACIICCLLVLFVYLCGKSQVINTDYPEGTVVAKYIEDGDFTDFRQYAWDMNTFDVETYPDEKIIYFKFYDYLITVRTNAGDPDCSYVAIGPLRGNMTYACLIPNRDVPEVKMFASGTSMPVATAIKLEQTIDYMEQHHVVTDKPDISGSTWVDFNQASLIVNKSKYSSYWLYDFLVDYNFLIIAILFLFAGLVLPFDIKELPKKIKQIFNKNMFPEHTISRTTFLDGCKQWIEKVRLKTKAKQILLLVSIIAINVFTCGTLGDYDYNIISVSLIVCIIQIFGQVLLFVMWDDKDAHICRTLVLGSICLILEFTNIYYMMYLFAEDFFTVPEFISAIDLQNASYSVFIPFVTTRSVSLSLSLKVFLEWSEFLFYSISTIIPFSLTEITAINIEAKAVSLVQISIFCLMILDRVQILFSKNKK